MTNYSPQPLCHTLVHGKCSNLLLNPPPWILRQLAVIKQVWQHSLDTVPTLKMPENLAHQLTDTKLSVLTWYVAGLAQAVVISASVVTLAIAAYSRLGDALIFICRYQKENTHADLNSRFPVYNASISRKITFASIGFCVSDVPRLTRAGKRAYAVHALATITNARYCLAFINIWKIQQTKSSTSAKLRVKFVLRNAWKIKFAHFWGFSRTFSWLSEVWQFPGSLSLKT